VHGSLPAELAQLTRLRQVHLHHNDITGRVPAFPALQQFSAPHNCLTGYGIAELLIQSSSTLQVVDVSYNCWVGPMFPQDRSKNNNNNAGAAALQYFFASDNFLTGPLPNNIIQQWTQLRTLDLARNRLTGTIPLLPASLWDLNLADNRNLTSSSTTSTFPSALLQLTELQSLVVSGNQLGGSLPQQWTALSSSSSLGILQLDRNQFVGSLPAALYEASQLRQYVFCLFLCR